MNETTTRRAFLKFLIASGVVLTNSGGAGAVLAGCEKTRHVSFEKVFDFLDHLEEAEILTPNNGFVKKTALSVKGERREVLFEHPPSEIIFRNVSVGKNPSLRFGVGIGDGAWEGGCDGVVFEILVADKERPQSIYSRTLEAGTGADDGGWIDEVVDLKPFEGKEVTFIFKTGAGVRGDNTSDWAGWSEPRLYSSITKRVGTARHANVILITLDTTRADHLSCYGYSRRSTPNLDRLAQKSLVFCNAISPSPWTIPAHASLFTGLYPVQHGAITRVDDGVLSGYPLPQYDGVLARVLQEHGYRTAGFVGGPFLKAEFGFSQGFDAYDDTWQGYDRPADRINRKVIPWLDGNYEDPFFLFVNYFDPHAPYNPPPAFDSPFKEPYAGAIDFTRFGPHEIKLGKKKPLSEGDVKRAIDLYDTEILFMDHFLGELLHRLEDLGALHNALFIITSDHGESFGENDIWGHGGLPIESQVRVPLIVFCPTRVTSFQEIRNQVQTTCIYTTILRFLNIPVPSGMSPPWYDIDLLGLAEKRDHMTPEFTFAERYYPEGYMAMIRSNVLKYLYKLEESKQEEAVSEWLFDLMQDPAEARNMLGQDQHKDREMRVQFSQMRRILSRSILDRAPSPSVLKQPLNNDMREKLKALGYVN